MKIFGHKDNIYDTVAALMDDGVVAIEGTKSVASLYIDYLLKFLKPYREIVPTTGYQAVPNNGCLYFVFDANRFAEGDKKLKQLMRKIDRQHPALKDDWQALAYIAQLDKHLQQSNH